MIGAFMPYVARLRRSYQVNDVVDRLNYQYTAMMVMLGAVTLAATQYVGKPIQCWVPAQFTGSWEKYTETLCFIKGSYYLPYDDAIDDDYIKRDEKVIQYYQWVPLVLAFQAFLFLFPSLMWRWMNFNTGINVKAILESAAKIKKKVDTKSREAQVQIAAAHMTEALEMNKEMKLRRMEVYRKFEAKSGMYLSWLYLFMKILFVVNIFAQFLIFMVFLDMKDFMWGLNILNELIAGKEWDQTGNFPRVTMCDFNVRTLGNVHRWTVQCVLMINMFTEKIFVSLWFWFIFVGVVTILSLFYWLAALVIPANQRAFISRYLRCMEQLDPHGGHKDDRVVDKFIKDFLTPDGVFICRLIETNGGDLLTGSIIAELFRTYNESKNDVESKPIETSFDSPDSSATLPR